MKEYAEAQDSLLEGKPTALDWFIVEYEPDQGKGREQFRKMLQEVIDEAILEYEKDNHSDSPTAAGTEPDTSVDWNILLMVVVIMAVAVLCLLTLVVVTNGVVSQ